MLIRTFYAVLEAYKESNHQLVQSMRDTKEDSPHHREESVFTHTAMVCEEFIRRWENMQCEPHGDVDQAMFIGGIAALFHDFGKPVVEEVVHSEERGVYRRYFSHELASATAFRDVWHDSAAKAAILGDEMLDLTPSMFAAVCLMIEHHLPYKYKESLAHGVLDALRFFGEHYDVAFTELLMSDAMGRITDSPDTQGTETAKWIAANMNRPSLDHPQPATKRAIVLIGPQGSGKSTFCRWYPPECIFSMDTIRVNQFGDGKHTPESYQQAWMNAQANKVQFDSAVNREINRITRSGQLVIISDNMNLNRKSRRQFITEARRNGYQITAVVFDHGVSLHDLHTRNDSRTDHKIPNMVIQSCRDRLRYPTMDEVDYIHVV